MNLETLKLYCDVVRLRSFSRGAAANAVSQSAASQAIQQLEAEVDAVLLDRSRRKQVVSTLRFWVAAEQPAVAARRRRIQQPWSLLLQLISMGLLILAIAQLRLGSRAASGRVIQ